MNVLATLLLLLFVPYELHVSVLKALSVQLNRIGFLLLLLNKHQYEPGGGGKSPDNLDLRD